MTNSNSLLNNTVDNKEVNTMTNTNGFRVFAEGRTVPNNTRITNLNNNDIVIGASGGGKSGGYVAYNVLNSDTSMVVADTKSSLHKKLAPRLRKKGYTVRVIDFINPEKSYGYNPLKHIRRNKKTGVYNQLDIISIANALIPLNNPEDAFWANSARGVLACAISYVLEAFDEESRNMWSVIKVYKAIACSPNYELKVYRVPFLDEWEAEHPDSFAVSKYHGFMATMCADRTWGCICQFVNAAVDKLEIEELKGMLCTNKTLDFSPIGKKKTVVFLNISDTDRSMDSLVNIFYTQLFQNLCRQADNNPDGKLKVPVRVFLDDFASNVRIENFDKLISVIRSREIYASIILQSLTQLQTIYNHAEASTIITNCDHILYLGGADYDTANFLAERMCVTPESILALPCDEVLLLERGKQGERLKKLIPYGCLENDSAANQDMMP